MQKQHHSFYLLLITFIAIVNALIYSQYEKSFASAFYKIKNKIPDNATLQNGDIILRNGRGLISSVFRQSSLHQRVFSHAGFIHKMKNQVYIYHFIDDVTKSGLHIETLQHFINANECSAYAVFRYQLNTYEQQRLETIIAAPRQNTIPFDSNFDLTTDSALYCTEWIAKTLTKATQQTDFIPTTTVGALTYIAPDNLYLNAHCTLIYKSEN